MVGIVFGKTHRFTGTSYKLLRAVIASDMDYLEPYSKAQHNRRVCVCESVGWYSSRMVEAVAY